MKADIVYFADQKNYPYGTKSQAQMASIIKKTICMLEEKFTPDVIVVASNTPSLMLNLQKGKVIDVKPPLKLAKQKTKSKKIGILATKSSVKSKGLVNYVKENNFPDSYKIFKINGTNLVDLVETGKFLNNENYCKKIIKKTICMLEEKFTPDVIVVASNTPSLMLNLQKGKIIDVKPPLKLAKQKTKSKKIGILATKSSVKSKGLVSYVKENNFPDSYKIFKINGSELVDLVETGKFLNNENYCKKIIKKSLEKYIITKKVDTITLSSTHLLFLKKLFEKEFPKVQFIDPGNLVAKKIFSKIKNKQSKRNSLKIFTSGNEIQFKNKLNKIGIKNKINYLST